MELTTSNIPAETAGLQAPTAPESCNLVDVLGSAVNILGYTTVHCGVPGNCKRMPNINAGHEKTNLCRVVPEDVSNERVPQEPGLK